MKFNSFFAKFFSNWPVKSLSLVAAIILYTFNYYNTQETVSLDVPLSVILPGGYALSAPHIRTIRLSVRDNPELGISELTSDDFTALADFSGSEIVNNTARTYITYQKKMNALQIEPLSDVSLEPSSITINLEKRSEKVVPVVAEITSGGPPEGYEIADYSWYPREAVISGPESRVRLVEKISTEAVSFEGRRKDFFLIIKPVITDDFIEVLRLDNIEFAASISEMLSQKNIAAVTIEYLGVDDRLEVADKQATGQIRIKAPNSILRNLREDSVSMTVNCANIKKPGKYTLKTTPQYPTNVDLIYYAPRELVIDFIQRK